MTNYREYQDDPILRGVETDTRTAKFLGFMALLIVLVVLGLVYIEKPDGKVASSEYETHRGAINTVKFVDDMFGFTLTEPNNQWIYNQLTYKGNTASIFTDHIGDTATVTVRFDYSKDSILIAKVVKCVKYK
jgi:hypothetical protein